MTESTLSAGKLSIGGTPIGNLSDASPRVKETLAAADVILCEDTRVTSKLLSALDIHVPLQRCDQNIIESQIEPTLDRIRIGQHVAFVSDAGMPGISDPGQHLVDAALSEGFATEVIPGPSAVTCALVASGLASEHFFFEGFLPRKHGQIVQRLQQLAAIPGTIVLYESPFRVLATVEAIAEVFPTRQVALVRELTKLHEEVVRDVAPCLVKTLAAKENLKGECVLVIAAPTEEELSFASSQAAGESPLSLEDSIQTGLAAGIRKSALAKELAQKFGIARDEAYQAILAHEAHSFSMPIKMQ